MEVGNRFVVPPIDNLANPNGTVSNTIAYWEARARAVGGVIVELPQ